MGNENLSLNKLTRISPFFIMFYYVLIVVCTLLFFSSMASIGKSHCMHTTTPFVPDSWCGIYQTTVFEFFWLERWWKGVDSIEDGTGLDAAPFFRGSFVPAHPPIIWLYSFSYIKIGKGGTGSSLGEIGLWRIVSTHSDAILSSEKYNELELWVLLSLPWMI